MIQIYDTGNEKFDFNGDATLEPYSCDCTMILNDAWGLELEAPIDENGKFLHIVKEAVISAPTPISDKQLFRIFHVDKSDTSVVAFAMPVFFDSKDDHILLDVRPTGKNGQQALDIICAGSKYSGESNITKASTAYYIRKNLMEAINGDINQSFVNRWGGEILYDNYKVIVNERVGGDYGARAEFGYNLTGIEETVDMSEVVTRIIPVSYNGHTLDGSKPWVDSPNINKYQKVYTKVIEFSDVMLAEDSPGDNPDACATLAELRTKLIAECNKQFESGIDLPAISYDVRLESLKGVAGYERLEILEDIGLGDDVKCKHRQLNIETTARATEIVYDCINRRNKEVKLGRFNQTALDSQIQTDKVVESITNPDGSIMAEKVQGILNGIYTQLKLQSTVAQKVKGRAFTVEDLDPDSDLFGCMTWGTQGLQLATRRTADGKDWDWTTAVTARGIFADAIIAGILTDKTGKNYWNLDTGEFRLSGEAFKVDDQTVEDYVNGKIDNATAQIRLLTLQLTNDMCSVATEADGTGGDYSECYTDVMLLIGTTDITNSDKVQYTINPSSGVDGSWDLTRKRYTVRGMSGDNGSVTITATYAGITVSKVFSISKVKSGKPGDNGDSLESIVEYYAVSSSNTIAPGQWYPNPPQMTEQNRYLWNYETFLYSGGRTEDTKKRVIGAYGATGNGISSITNYYLATSQQSGVTASTYGWTTTPQTMTEQKKYLWNYETIIYTDKSVYTVPPHIIGAYGNKGLPGSPGSDGRTSYVHIKFSDVPNPQYSSQIKESPGKYIGIYVDFEELDSTSPSRYTWTQFMGDNGQDGKDGVGIPGTDGKTSYVHFAYANSADGRTGFSTTDSTNKLYIGQYVDYVQNDSTDPARYSWTRIKGENGTDGRIFFMQANATVIKQGADNKYNPGAARFEGKQRIGSGRTQSYHGRFKIEETSNGSTWTQKYLSRTDEYYCQYTLFTTDIKQIRCTMYKSGGTSEILDMQTVAVVRDIDNLTQEEVFNILTDNGRIQGIFMRDGMLYVNGEYIKADSISADKLKSKSITADKLNVSDLYALAATIAGWKINRNYISSTKDNIRLYSDGRIQIGSVIVSSNSQAMTVKNGMHVYYSTDEFGDGSGEFKLVNIHTFSSGAHLILGSNGTSVLKLSSSSKRYKDHIGYMSSEEAEKILDIPVVWFKYKDGYLRSDDAFVGKPIPGFYAEDVEEHYPVAVQRNEDGSVEDWNYRTLIPAMLKMIQTMHDDIEQLKELLKKEKNENGKDNNSGV
jgi:phage minor structural protein